MLLLFVAAMVAVCESRVPTTRRPDRVTRIGAKTERQSAQPPPLAVRESTSGSAAKPANRPVAIDEIDLSIRLWAAHHVRLLRRLGLRVNPFGWMRDQRRIDVGCPNAFARRDTIPLTGGFNRECPVGSR
jgi:hypothetical protein